MLNAKFGFQLFPVFLAVSRGLPDGFVEERPLFLALLEFACQFDSDFIWFAVSVDDFVDDVDHLIENLFNNRITQAVAFQNVKVVLVCLCIEFLFCQRSGRMAITSQLTCLAVFVAIHHVW